MSEQNKRILNVLVSERAKNICGAPYGSVVENLDWLVAKTAEIVRKEVAEWLSQNIRSSSSYHNAVCKELIFIEALKEGRMPDAR